MKTIFWGVLVLAILFLILSNQQAVTQYFTRGGFSAPGVIAATLMFYFLAGAFADSLGKAMGLRAGKKIEGEE